MLPDVYGIFYEVNHDNCLIFITVITYCAALRSFDGKSVKNVILVCKKRNIPTLYVKVNECLGQPVYYMYMYIHSQYVGRTCALDCVFIP